jgi:hypothetical protein
MRSTDALGEALPSPAAVRPSRPSLRIVPWPSSPSRCFQFFLPAIALLTCAVAAAAHDPPPDATIELWEQHWTLNDDGSTVYYEKQHVRIRGDRAYGEFADRRITHHVDTDQLEVLTARTRLPDGSYRELPPYARVQASPGGPAGKPAFASIRQEVLVMPGIEAGCVLEVEYRITTKPGARPYLAGDVRLDHRYPIQRRIFGVSTPRGVECTARIFGLPPDRLIEALDPPPETTQTHFTERWRIIDLPAAPDDPQAPPWQTRGVRYVFSTAGPVERWLSTELDMIEAAAETSPLISRLAAEWTKDLTDPAEKMRALQSRLAASFNFVTFDPSWRRGRPRRASLVAESNYGTPEEAAALLISLAWAAEVPARPGAVVPDETWVEDTPQAAFMGTCLAITDGGAGPQFWDPQHGRVVRGGAWSGVTVMSPWRSRLAERLKWMDRLEAPVASAGPAAVPPVQRWPLPAFTEADESRCDLRGTLTVAADGKVSGKLTLRTCGLFVSPESLRSREPQQARVADLVRRVLPETEVASFTVTLLTDERFEAEAEVKTSKPLEKLGECYRLTLAADGPFQADVPLPLASDRRSTSVRLKGAFDSRLELLVEWPAGWQIEARPSPVSAVTADEAVVVRQVIDPDEKRLSMTRHVRFERPEVAPADFALAREALSNLRSEHGRTLLLRP